MLTSMREWRQALVARLNRREATVTLHLPSGRIDSRHSAAVTTYRIHKAVCTVASCGWVYVAPRGEAVQISEARGLAHAHFSGHEVDARQDLCDVVSRRLNRQER